MKIALRLLATSVTAFAMAVATPASATVIVDFAFDGVSNYAGHVTGQLQFANAGTNVAATAAYVFTSTNPQVAATPSKNLLSGGYVQSNIFNVSANGVISAANLYVYNDKNYLLLNYSPYYNIFQYISTATLNRDGFSGVTYSAVAGAVPEPASWAMLIVGFAIVGAANRRRYASLSGLAA